MTSNTVKLHNNSNLNFGPKVTQQNLFVATLSFLVKLQDRLNQSNKLHQLDEENLTDMGITRAQANAAADKPFWWYKR